uniref:Glycerol-3-phosphate dehydrogenase n=1 Tax=Trypanosoma vivax (strain Y486) TaxID=1055687 RepID=G0UBW0_TRYVY|nr:putative glycerol-3-phosphate dehydrogenase, fragment [Trypanosoma vivax Y486]
MSTAAKKILYASAAAFTGVVGIGYTNPRWTQRRFGKPPIPLVHQENPTREDCMKKLENYISPENPMDVLIVGGGSVGAGTALDAVTRGLTVGLVEMNDYASGTSSRSTKLIHGGIRYLEKAVFKLDVQQLKLVAEALRERIIMIHQAPHLCRNVATMIPCYNPFDVAKFWCGVKLYDLIAIWERGTLEYAGFLTPYATMKKFPMLKHGNREGSVLFGSVQYYDGQMNDARMCLSVALTAASYGAATVNYTKVKKMEVVKNEKGEQVVKSTIHDRINEKEFIVYSKSVVNAGGPFSAQVEKLMTDKPSIRMAPSSGTHLVIDAKYCPKESAMVIPSNDGRVVFSVSWLDGCLVGTTDRGCEVSEDIRPSKAEHIISVDKDNLMLSVTGGKWTTYRKIAQDAVDSLRDTVLKGRVAFKPCVTEELQVVGAHDFAKIPTDAPADIPQEVHTHWRKQYGDRYNVLLDMVRKDPELLRRLHPEEPVVAADVVYAVKQEHCERVVDFIARRTRLSFLNAEHARAVIPEVARVMAEAKNWCRTRKNEEVAQAFASLDSFRGN